MYDNIRGVSNYLCADWQKVSCGKWRSLSSRALKKNEGSRSWYWRSHIRLPRAAPSLLPHAPSVLPLKQPRSLSRTKTAIINPKFRVYIMSIYIYLGFDREAVLTSRLFSQRSWCCAGTESSMESRWNLSKIGKNKAPCLIFKGWFVEFGKLTVPMSTGMLAQQPQEPFTPGRTNSLARISVAIR